MTMKISSTKDSVDLGIIIRDWAATRRFYCEVLGLEHTADMVMPIGNGTMHRVQAGSVTLKFSEYPEPRAAANPAGGPVAAYGVRYFTFWIDNLEDTVGALGDAGYEVTVPITEVRPGVRIAMVIDPDGNWVEFLQAA